MGIKDYLKAGAVAAVCFAVMILVFSLILHFPVRAQITSDPSKPNYTKAPMELEADYKDPVPIWETHQGRIEKLSVFNIPSNNRITEDQIHRYYKVVDHCLKRLAEFKKTYLGQAKGFGKALAMYAYSSTALQLCKVEGLDLAQMRDEEFEWVQTRLFEVSLFALNRKFETGDILPEQKVILQGTREQLCFVLGFYKESPGKIEYFPEKLNLNNIPRGNVALFLKFKNEVRYSKVNFENIEFNEADILNAAQQLPP